MLEITKNSKSNVIVLVSRRLHKLTEQVNRKGDVRSDYSQIYQLPHKTSVGSRISE